MPNLKNKCLYQKAAGLILEVEIIKFFYISFENISDFYQTFTKCV